MNLSKQQAVRAYLDGEPVQFQAGDGWMIVNQFYLFDHYQFFRLKPKDTTVVRKVHISPDGGIRDRFRTPNLRLEWDIDTNKLINAEIIT